MQGVSRTAVLSVLATFAGIVVSTGCSDSNDPLIPGGGDTVLQVDANGGGEFADVSSAVQSAGPGAVIQIGPGTYSGRIVVSKGVTLVGSGPATVLTAPGTVQSFPDDSGDDDLAVIEIRGTGGVTIRDLAVQGPVDGIVVRDSFDIAILDVVSSGNGDEGVDIRSSRNVSVRGEFSGNGDKGVQAREGSSSVEITSSTISGNVDHGVLFRDSTDCALRGSTVDANGDDGVRVRESSGAAVTANTITGNDGYGIRLVDAADTVVEENTVDGNGEGNLRVE